MLPSLKPLKGVLFKYGSMTIPQELIFYEKRYIYAIVPFSLKIKDHVMVIPKRSVLGMKDLTPPEIAELGISIKLLSQMLENINGATASTVSVKNYLPTEKKLNHMCVHVVPRKKGDLEDNDDVYRILNEHEQGFIREYDLFVRNNDDDTKAKMLNLFQLTEEYKKRLRGISK